MVATAMANVVEALLTEVLQGVETLAQQLLGLVDQPPAVVAVLARLDQVIDVPCLGVEAHEAQRAEGASRLAWLPFEQLPLQAAVASVALARAKAQVLEEKIVAQGFLPAVGVAGEGHRIKAERCSQGRHGG